MKRKRYGYTKNRPGRQACNHVAWRPAWAAPPGLYPMGEEAQHWGRIHHSNRRRGHQWRPRLSGRDPSSYNFVWFIDNRGKAKTVVQEGDNPGFALFKIRFSEDCSLIIVLLNLEIAPVWMIALNFSHLLFGEPRAAMGERREDLGRL